MDLFEYRQGELYCEQVPVAQLCKEFGTPLYVYSHGTLVDHFRKLDTAFAEVDHLMCFSVKSNSNLAVIRSMGLEGSGADVVSGGELFRVLKAGIDPSKVVFAGVGKTVQEIEQALEANILMFNVESMPEAVAINEVAARLDKVAHIAFRVNPDVDPKTHRHITTGKKGNKFGIDIHVAKEFFLQAAELPNLDVCGVHAHIGSQITELKPYHDALSRMLVLIDGLRSSGLNITNLNIGGGLGIIYQDEEPHLASDFAETILPYVKKSGCRLILEPGRFITGNAGILVGQVVYIKETDTKRFVIIDAAMNDLIRPSFYEAYHRIEAVSIRTEEYQVADVVGPICESGDFLAKDRKLRNLEAGEYLAMFSAGAYGFVMSSNYNSRPRAAEVLVKGDQYALVRQRETYDDLVRGEDLPDILES